MDYTRLGNRRQLLAIPGIFLGLLGGLLVYFLRPPLEDATPVGLRKPPAYIISLIPAADGTIWAASEGEGVHRYDIVGGTWKQFSTKDGLADKSAFAIACDRMGRIWVGHLNHGISVFDGNKWQSYEPIGGGNRTNSLTWPLSERVFDIAVSPTNGDVWITTDSGLTRYSEERDAWSYYTKADGLSSDQIRSIAFDSDGTMYLGTQCDGIAIGRASDGYKTWRVVPGPDRLPTTAFGDGLPSGMINDLLVTKDGIVYAATVAGLAWSSDRGQTWRYIRGKDWIDKVRGLARHSSWSGGNARSFASRRLCHLSGGGQEPRVMVGYRQSGAARVRPGTWEHTTFGNPNAFVTAILPFGDDDPFIATYGNEQIVPSPNSAQTRTKPEPISAPKLPAGAAPPTSQELKALLTRQLGILPASGSDSTIFRPVVIAMDDDWRTQGDWVGRYGKYWAILCGMVGHDYIWGTGRLPAAYAVTLGSHKEEDDTNRYWVQQNYTDDRRILELPSVYLDSRIAKNLTTAAKNRRDSQWDDHGEEYVRSFDGPHLFFTVRVPVGSFCLSIYEVNSNGHSGKNRYRDFWISVRNNNNIAINDIRGFDLEPELASARVTQFRGGVYKRFAIKGPAHLTVKIDRNYSLNANVAGVFLDEFTETPAPYFQIEDEDRKVDNASSIWPNEPEIGEIGALIEEYAARYFKDPFPYIEDRGRTFAFALRYLEEQANLGKISRDERLGP